MNIFLLQVRWPGPTPRAMLSSGERTADRWLSGCSEVRYSSVTNHRPVFRSRDLFRPILDQYSCDVMLQCCSAVTPDVVMMSLQHRARCAHTLCVILALRASRALWNSHLTLKRILRIASSLIMFPSEHLISSHLKMKSKSYSIKCTFPWDWKCHFKVRCIWRIQETHSSSQTDILNSCWIISWSLPFSLNMSVCIWLHLKVKYWVWGGSRIPWPRQIYVSASQCSYGRAKAGEYLKIFQLIRKNWDSSGDAARAGGAKESLESQEHIRDLLLRCLTR